MAWLDYSQTKRPRDITFDKKGTHNSYKSRNVEPDQTVALYNDVCLCSIHVCDNNNMALQKLKIKQ